MPRRRKRKLSNYLFYFILTISFLSFLYVTYNDHLNDIKEVQEELQGIKVSYLDVGQADSILIQVDNENMLIDAGNNNDGKGIVKYLKDNKVDSFKYVIGTHAHEDHIGGMENIIKEFQIEHFYMPSVLTTTKTFEDVLDALEEKQLKFETPSINDEFNLGEAIIKVLYVGDDSSNLNNTSIVLKLTYKNIKFLFMGDLEKDKEDEIEDLDCDILKTGHHGSNTSSSKEFLDKVSPSYSVISVGKDNSYKHPSSKTIKRLDNINSKILRTDELGTIIITSDGENINYYGIKTDIDGG